MAVLRPLKVVIENYPRRQVEHFEVAEQPRGPVRRDAAGAVRARAVDRAGRLPRGAAAQVLPAEPRRRGAPARRLPDALHRRREGPATGGGRRRCARPTTRRRGSGNAPDGRKVKATIHWVSAAHAIEAEVRLYDTLFTRGESRGRSRGRGLHRRAQPRLARGRCAAASSSRRSRRPRRACRSSSSGVGYFVADAATRGRARRCSIARSRSRTPGRGSRRSRVPECRSSQGTRSARRGPGLPQRDSIKR